MNKTVFLQVQELTDQTISAIPDSSCTFVVSLLLIICITLAVANRKKDVRIKELTDKILTRDKQHKDTLETLKAFFNK